MITKEFDAVKKCCLYASDFHLEMILLPYIKERINKSNFIIITQNDLSESIKILLDRVNINNEEKQTLLSLNWKVSNKEDIECIKKLIKNEEFVDIIVNGDCKYIKEINNDLKLLDNNNIHIIDCFNINDRNLIIEDIKNNYKEVLNTSKM